MKTRRNSKQVVGNSSVSPGELEDKAAFLLPFIQFGSTKVCPVWPGWSRVLLLASVHLTHLLLKGHSSLSNRKIKVLQVGVYVIIACLLHFFLLPWLPTRASIFLLQSPNTNAYHDGSHNYSWQTTASPSWPHRSAKTICIKSYSLKSS